MVCDPFLLMSECGSAGGEETLWEQNRLPWDHSDERGGERPRQKV